MCVMTSMSVLGHRKTRGLRLLSVTVYAINDAATTSQRSMANAGSRDGNERLSGNEAATLMINLKQRMPASMEVSPLRHDLGGMFDRRHLLHRGLVLGEADERIARAWMTEAVGIVGTRHVDRGQRPAWMTP